MMTGTSLKRISLILVLSVIAALDAWGVVAPKTAYPYTQPDGTVVMLVNHGDEFESWVTMNGVEVEMDSEGYYRPVQNVTAVRAARRSSAASLRAQAARMRAQARSEGISKGAKRFLVLLIEFNDLKFSTVNAKEAFSDMLNKEGYDYNGATGSVNQYYYDNSCGQFDPSFDVYGPVSVPESYAYYGQDIGSDRSSHATQALREACALLDDQIDYSLYDNDGDGFVDNTFFFFAGYNQSEGGDANTIWPHQYHIPGEALTLDGVRVYRYGCTSEYKGSSGAVRAGIGTFCHEFGHSLGLLDLYDTNGDTNGAALNPGYYSLMASGNYLNQGRTPPYLTSLERQMLGWMEDFRSFPGDGVYTLGPLSAGTVPYITPTDVSGEYFLYEMRDAAGWDMYLPKGLVIYHVDNSENVIAPGVTSAMAWSGHYVNRYGDHPCYYPVFTGGNWFHPTAWSGDKVQEVLTNLVITGTDAQLSIERTTSSRKVFGTVTDTNGNVLSGAQVSLLGVSAITGADGNYNISVPSEESGDSFEVRASLDGYVTSVYEITVKSILRQDFVLRSVATSPSAQLKKYPDTGPAYGLGNQTKPKNIMGAVHFSAAELMPYAGMTLKTINFMYAEAEPYSLEEAYVIVDRGNERILTQKVDNPSPYAFIEVDVSAAGIRVTPGEEMYIGYALKNVNAYYPLLRRAVADLTDGSYMSSYSLSRSSWSGESGQAMLVGASLFDNEAVAFINLAAMGFNSIDNPDPAEGYHPGDVFNFRLNETQADPPSSVSWYYDGVLQEASSTILTAGEHTVEAHLIYPDGGSEVLSLELNIN